MFNFDAVLKKHSESFMLQIVETWERYNSVSHTQPLSLEDRWAFFIQSTEPVAARAAA